MSWLGSGKGCPPMMMAFRDDGVSAIVIGKSFNGYEEKVKVWTTAAGIIPAIGAERAVIVMDTFMRLPRPGEKRQDFEAAYQAHVGGRSLADDPLATDAINITVYDGPSERMDAVVMPYTIRPAPAPSKQFLVNWGREFELDNEHDQALGWMPELLQAAVQTSVQKKMPALLAGVFPAMLEHLGYKVIIEGEIFSQN